MCHEVRRVPSLCYAMFHCQNERIWVFFSFFLARQLVGNEMVAQISHFSAVTLIISIGAENQQRLLTLTEALTAQWKDRRFDNSGPCTRASKTKQGYEKWCVWFFVVWLVGFFFSDCEDAIV